MPDDTGFKLQLIAGVIFALVWGILVYLLLGTVPQ